MVLSEGGGGAEMRDERAAHNAPGVTEVNNLLAIDSGVYAGVM